jgi:thymidine phosphorylase
VILLRCVGKYALTDTEVNYEMATFNQNNISESTFAAFLTAVYFMFSSQVDASLLVDPTSIGQELQSFATDALGVDEMQVSRRHELQIVLVG